MTGPARIYYEVLPVPGGDEGWNITRDGHVVAWEPTKADAVETATDQARDEANAGQPTSVRIKRKDGRIQTEHSYGTDPRRHPG